MSRPQSTSLTQEHRTLRPLDLTAPYEIESFGHKNNGLPDAFEGESYFVC